MDQTFLVTLMMKMEGITRTSKIILDANFPWFCFHSGSRVSSYERDHQSLLVNVSTKLSLWWMPCSEEEQSWRVSTMKRLICSGMFHVTLFDNEEINVFDIWRDICYTHMWYSVFARNSGCEYLDTWIWFEMTTIWPGLECEFMQYCSSILILAFGELWHLEFTMS